MEKPANLIRLAGSWWSGCNHERTLKFRVVGLYFVQQNVIYRDWPVPAVED